MSLLTLVSPSGLVDLALKSALVMLVAVVAAALLKRGSAAWRHLVWCLSVASLLLLPAFSLALPAWRVTWLPQWAGVPTQLVATESGPRSFLPSPPGGSGIAGEGETSPASQGEDRTPPSGDVSSAEASPAPAAAAVEPIMPAGGPFPWLAFVWAAGVLLSLVPLASGLWQLVAVHRRSRVIDDQRWLALLAALRRQLALRRSVQLRRSTAVLVPLTWGALRPVLLVPAEAGAWSDERRRLVLLHELAHVRRWDWLTQLAAHVACALYWFNPLVWLAARQMRIERERACDDLVLASGARASDYAQELLALAAGLSHSQLSALVAVPMARRGALEDRLCGILDSRRSRAALTWSAVCVGVALAVGATSPLAMLCAALPESAKSGTEEPTQEPPVKERPAATNPVEKPAEAAAAPQKDPLLGQEAAERVEKFRPSFSKGQEGVEIGISLASDRKAFHDGERVPLELVIRNVSQKTLVVQHSLYPPETPPTVIDADGKQLSIEAIFLTGVNRRYRNSLKPNEVVVYRHLGLGLGPKPDPGTFWNPFLNFAVPGKYRLSQMVSVTVREEGRDDGTLFHTATGEIAFEIEPAEAAKGAEKPAEKAGEKPAEPQAARTVAIRGKVVDVDTGEPIKQFTISQAGTYDPLNPGKSNWVPKEDGPSAGDGSFSTTVTWTEGWTVRVRAAGYFPQALLTSAPPADKEEIVRTVRLERVPEKVRGLVRDHAGKPVKGAAVFAVGPTGLNLAAGQALSEAWPGENKKNGEARPVLTDEQGRFELATGGATKLAVSHAKFDAWTAPIPPSGGMTIRLPEPARVEVELNINGAGNESTIFYQLLPELDDVVRSSRWLSITNPGTLLLDALPPGKYQLCRYASTGAMLERQLFALKAGERKTIDYVRNKGARVRGKLTWPADATGIAIRILGESNATVASTSPAGDGTYLTERIPPGTYGLVAWAYKPLTPERMTNTSPIVPSYQAQMTIDVPADGEVTVKDLALEPIKRGK